MEDAATDCYKCSHLCIVERLFIPCVKSIFTEQYQHLLFSTAHTMDSEGGIDAIAQTHRFERKGVLRDWVIGFADGLTVPFALTAGLSSYVLLHRPYVTYWCQGCILTGCKLRIIQAGGDRWSGRIGQRFNLHGSWRLPGDSI